MALPDYEDVREYGRIQGHHGGRAVVYKSTNLSVRRSGYFVVDAESETVLKKFDSAERAYVYALGYDEDQRL